MARLLTVCFWLVGVVSAAGCGGSQPAASVPPRPLPLPTAGIAGRAVTVYPLTRLVSAPELGWADMIGARDSALARSDSVIGAFLDERAPEVTWVGPEALRRAARRAPGMLADPDQMGTALLRAPDLDAVPDPLRSQMRTLTGVAGDRYALVPANLTFVPAAGGQGTAYLTLVLVDVRRGLVGWRTVAWGEGDDPWAALWEALRKLVPDLP